MSFPVCSFKNFADGPPVWPGLDDGPYSNLGPAKPDLTIYRKAKPFTILTDERILKHEEESRRYRAIGKRPDGHMIMAASPERIRDLISQLDHALKPDLVGVATMEEILISTLEAIREILKA